MAEQEAGVAANAELEAQAQELASLLGPATPQV